jgi:hypothetical protein
MKLLICAWVFIFQNGTRVSTNLGSSSSAPLSCRESFQLVSLTDRLPLGGVFVCHVFKEPLGLAIVRS